MNKLGFIGMGNMAQALAGGFISGGMLKKEQVLAYAPHQEKLRENAARIGFLPMETPEELVKNSDVVLMACKPYQVESVLKQIGEGLKGKALLSVCAGWDAARYGEFLDPSVRFQYIMPNTPARVGAGVLLFEEKNSLDPEERREVMELFRSVGQVKELPSHLMGIGTAVTGCTPAFVDMMMEAFADAAVKYGIPRADAYEMISQMVLGTALLQQKTGLHPGVLKDQVCSPNGTTICGVAALEESGFRSACIRSIDAVMNKKI